MKALAYIAGGLLTARILLGPEIWDSIFGTKQTEKYLKANPPQSAATNTELNEH